MVIVKEIIVDLIKKFGEKILVGQSIKLEVGIKIYIVQFLIGCVSGNDIIEDFQVIDLYKNGLLFIVYNMLFRDFGSFRLMRFNYFFLFLSILCIVRNIISSIVLKLLNGLILNNNLGIISKFFIVNIFLLRFKFDVDILLYRFNDV